MAEILFENAAGIFETVVFDVTIRENHVAPAEIPRHPVEESADLTDHVRILPIALTLEVAVSNRPIQAPISQFTGEPAPGVSASPYSLELAAVAARQVKDATISVAPSVTIPVGVGVTLGGDAKVTGGAWGLERSTSSASHTALDARDRVRQVWDTLEGLRGKPVTVLTSLRQYDGVAISNVGAPVFVVGYTVFTIDFEAVRQFVTETVPDPIEPRGRPKTQRGAQSGYPVPVAQQSGARQVTDGITSWLQRDSRPAT